MSDSTKGQIGNIGVIVTLMICLFILLAFAIPTISSIVNSPSYGQYTEVLLLNASKSTAASQSIYSVTSLDNITSKSASGTSTDPGTDTFTLSSDTPAAAMITIDGGAYGDIYINGNYIDTLDGTGNTQSFSIPYGYLHAGSNTVVFS